MRRLMTKLLACCLVFALALTMCAGAFSVSAASTGTLTVGEVTVNKGAATAVVPVVLATDSADGYAMATYTIVVPAELQAITDVAVVCDSETNPAVVSYLDAEGNVVAVAAGANSATAPAIDAEGNINFKVDCTDITLAGPASITVNITFDVSAAAAATYAIAVAEVVAGDFNAEYVDVTAVEGSVTVKQGAELDEDLKFYMDPSASIQDTLGVGYILHQDVVTKYAKVVVEIVADKYDTNRNVVTMAPVEIEPARLSATSSLYSAVYSGIAMFELDQKVVATIKAYDAEGNYVAYSAPVEKTPVELLKATYNASTATKNKQLITDMFNLATAGQKYFAKEGSELASAPLINDGWDQTYASTGDPSLATGITVEWADNAPLTEADLTVTPQLNLAATPTMSYLVYDKKSKLDGSNLRMEFAYTAALPSKLAGERTETVAGDAWTAVSVYEMATFSKLTLADSNQPVVANLYYNDQLVVTVTTTMDNCISNLLGNAKSGEISLALGRFEASARAYFS